MTYEIPKGPSPQVKAILHYLDQIKVLNLEEIRNIFADDFVQATRPLSLGVPARNKEEDLVFLKGLADLLKGRSLEVIYCDPLSYCAELNRRWTGYHPRYYRVAREGLGPCA